MKPVNVRFLCWLVATFVILTPLIFLTNESARHVITYFGTQLIWVLIENLIKTEDV